MFKTAQLISAYEHAPEDGTVTDEAMAMEIAGHSIYLFLHEGDNRKNHLFNRPEISLYLLQHNA